VSDPQLSPEQMKIALATLEKAGIVKLTGRTHATGHVIAQHGELTDVTRTALLAWESRRG
jgi:predicted RNA-binding protein YlqC (UPF0109 family)